MTWTAADTEGIFPDNKIQNVSHYLVTLYKVDGDSKTALEGYKDIKVYGTRYLFDADDALAKAIGTGQFCVGVKAVNGTAAGAEEMSTAQDFVRPLPTPKLEIRLKKQNSGGQAYGQYLVLTNASDYQNAGNWQVTAYLMNQPNTKITLDASNTEAPIANGLGSATRLRATATPGEGATGAWMESARYDEEIGIPKAGTNINSGLVHGTAFSAGTTMGQPVITGITADNLSITVTLQFTADANTIPNTVPNYRVMLVGKYNGEETISNAAEGTAATNTKPLKGQYVTLAALEKPVYSSGTEFVLSNLPAVVFDGSYTDLKVISVPIDAGYPQVPIITNDDVDFHNVHPGFKMNVRSALKVAFTLPMIDALEELLRKMRPYETEPGCADRAFNEALDLLMEGLRGKSLRSLKHGFTQAIDVMKKVPYDRTHRKPQVLIVGEYLLNFHPGANHDVELYLERNGLEVIEARMTDVIRKTYFYQHAQEKEYRVTRPLKEKAWHAIADNVFDVAHNVCDSIACAHPLYEPPCRMPDLVRASDPIIHHTFDAGEGVLIPGEILHHAAHGCTSFLILQPFGCLPNHVVGRGIAKRLKELYPQANILPLDYDPDVSFANIENRLQMLILSAKGTENSQVEVEKASARTPQAASSAVSDAALAVASAADSAAYAAADVAAHAIDAGKFAAKTASSARSAAGAAAEAASDAAAAKAADTAARAHEAAARAHEAAEKAQVAASAKAASASARAAAAAARAHEAAERLASAKTTEDRSAQKLDNQASTQRRS